MWREFWKEAKIPSSPNEAPYLWAVIAAGHFLIGAAASQLLPGFGLLIVAAYFILKEWRDYRSGGRVFDGLVDTFFIFLGVFQLALVAVFAIAAGITFYRRIQKL